MLKGRSLHACAMQGNDVFVAGGTPDRDRTLEIWNGKAWVLLKVSIDATGQKMINNGRKLFIYGGAENTNIFTNIHPVEKKFVNQIWNIDQNMKLVPVGNVSISRFQYHVLTIPHSFLIPQTCKGIYLICNGFIL